MQRKIMFKSFIQRCRFYKVYGEYSIAYTFHSFRRLKESFMSCTYLFNNIDNYNVIHANAKKSHILEGYKIQITFTFIIIPWPRGNYYNLQNFYVVYTTTSMYIRIFVQMESYYTYSAKEGFLLVFQLKLRPHLTFISSVLRFID